MDAATTCYSATAVKVALGRDEKLIVRVGLQSLQTWHGQETYQTGVPMHLRQMFGVPFASNNQDMP